MVRKLAIIVAVNTLLSAGAEAGTLCDAPADEVAFEVTALKSQMIVMAVSCPGADTQYNAFVERFRPLLQADDKVVNAWFKKIYGRSAQREYDAYTTNLINEQSRIGLAQGTDFCARTVALFSEAQALPALDDLPAYSAGKDLVPPLLGVCPAPPVKAPPPRAVRRPRPKKS